METGHDGYCARNTQSDIIRLTGVVCAPTESKMCAYATDQ